MFGVQHCPSSVFLGDEFKISFEIMSITLSCESPTSYTIERGTTLEDPDKNEFDIPLSGPEEMDGTASGVVTFKLRFLGTEELVAGRQWPLEFKLKKNGSVIDTTTVYVKCFKKP